MNANAQVVKHNINITKEHQIVEQLKKRIEDVKGMIVVIENRDGHTADAKTELDILENIMKNKEWTDKHTKIVKESEEKFKTHTKDQEVDI